MILIAVVTRIYLFCPLWIHALNCYFEHQFLDIIMEEVLLRKKCKSQADLSIQFVQRFEGKMHKVGRKGLLQLFFPKNSELTQSSKSPRRKIYSSISNTTKDSSKTLSLPRINKTSGCLHQGRKNRMEIDKNCPARQNIPKLQKDRLRI